MKAFLQGWARLVVVAWFMAGSVYAAEAPGLSLSPTQQLSLGVRLAPLQAAQSSLGSAWSGVVRMPPSGFEQIVAPLSGRVLRVEVAAGEEVKAGQVLMTLFSADWVNLTQAVKSAQANEALVTQTLAREQRLWREGIGVERRVREAETALQQARIEREAAQARLAGASGGQVASLVCNTELVVRAPRAGRLLTLDALPGAALNAGEPVASLGFTAQRWVEAEVPLSMAQTLQPGQTALIDGNEGANLNGKVLALGSVVDSARQTVNVRVGLEQGESLRPGQRVALRFAEGQSAGLWRVPRAALVQVDGALSVFVQRGEVFLPVAVQERGLADGIPAVQGAFLPADRVAVEGAVLLKGAWEARAGAAP